jgi:hypothetical protein
MTLTQMWRTLLGVDAEMKRATDAAYLDGFMAGLKTFRTTAPRGPAYMAGFTDGRDSVRTVPLGSEEDTCATH